MKRLPQSDKEYITMLSKLYNKLIKQKHTSSPLDKIIYQRSIDAIYNNIEKRFGEDTLHLFIGNNLEEILLGFDFDEALQYRKIKSEEK